MMKKSLYLLPVLSILLLNNCKYFKKEEVQEPKEIDVDTTYVDTLPVRAHEDVYLLQEINDKFLIIVGSFESVEYALVHAQKYGRYGLDTKVIQKPDGFFMVSARAFESHDLAHKELKPIKIKYAKNAWIYLNERVIDPQELAMILSKTS